MLNVVPVVQHVFLFAAFILLLLSTLSTPIINSIDLMTATVKIGVSFLSVHDGITFGVWGLCTTGAGVDLFSLDDDWDGDCTKPKLGYSTSFSSDSHVKNLLHGSLAKALITFPLATAFTFLALVLSLYTHYHTTRRRSSHLSTPTRPPSRTHRLISLTHTLSLILAGIFAFLSFTMSLTVASKASDVAHKSDGVLSISYGKAIWMALVAWILVTLVKLVGLAGWYVERRNRRRAERGYESEKI